MAPEQARGAAIDHRSDLFSLGAVLYRMCTGQVPFPGTNTPETLRALEQCLPEPPNAINPTVPHALSDLILRLLTKKPEDRLPSARAVAEGAGDPPAGKSSTRQP